MISAPLPKNVTRLPRTRRQAKVSLPPVSEATLDASRRQGNARPNPALAFTAPLHPPSAMPPEGAAIAQDDAISEAWGWAQTAMSSAFAEGTTFLGYSTLSVLAQRAEYRVVSEVIASEMTREWIEFKSTGDDDKSERIAQIEAEMKRLDVREAFRRGGAVYDGLFGRGHIYLDTGDTDDRDELKTPIGDGWNLMSRAKIGPEGHNGRTEDKRIKALRPVEPVWCYPTQYDSNDPLKPNWYKPTTWHVMGKEIHASRLLTFVGREVPDMLKPAYSFGGLSATQMLKPYVDNWLRTRQAVSDKVANYSVRGLKTPGVAASLMAGGDLIFRRAEVFNNLASNSGLMLLGNDEEFFEVASPLSTLEQLQAQSQEHMAAIARVPLVKLLGIQPAGLNATSEGEIRAFYDWISAFQELLFRPNLHTVVGHIMLGLWGEVDKEIGFDFKDLWQLDAEKKVAVEKTKTDIDDANVAMGSVSPEEVRQRIAADPDSPYAGLDLDPDALPEPPEPDPSEMMGHNGGPEFGGEEQQPEPGAGQFGAKDAGDEVHVYLEAADRPVARAHDAWEEGKHPRGQPENAGQFGSGGGKKAPKQKSSAAETKDQAPTPEAQRESVKGVTGFLRMVAGVQESSKLPEGMTAPARLVLQHGRQFIFDDLSYKGKRGKAHGCYMNAGRLALADPRKTYVEGYVSVHGVPIEHAWVVDEAGKVQDPTITDAHGILGYFGIPFETSYLEQIILKHETWGIFDFTKQDVLRDNPKDFVKPGLGERLNQGDAKTPDENSASYLLEKYSKDVTVEGLLASQPREVGQAIRTAEKKLAESVPTNALVSQGGFKNEDGTYTPDRQKLHLDIVRKILTKEAVDRARPAEGEKPEFTMIGGRAGSGKSYFTQEKIVGDGVLTLDNDQIKSMIPEYQGWNAALCHEEASDIFDRVDGMARELGVNVAHDCTMKTYISAQRRIDAYKEKGYKIKTLYMFAPPHEAAQRAIGRFMQAPANVPEGSTGRYVPPSYVLGSTTNEASFDALRDSVDEWAIYKSFDTKVDFKPELVAHSAQVQTELRKK